jgi:hypothetical protein
MCGDDDGDDDDGEGEDVNDDARAVVDDKESEDGVCG